MSRTEDASSVLEAAMHYRDERGWCPIPVRADSRVPSISKWPEFEPSNEALQTHFDDGRSNVGVLLELRSGELVDIYLDCPEARSLGLRFLPTSGCRLGRESARASHFLYRTSPLPGSQCFRDPTSEDLLLEIRSGGCLTLLPPSTHPSGEAVEFELDANPARVDRAALSKQVSRLAAAALLAKHWPGRDGRHDASLALAVMLVRGDWGENEALHFVATVAQAAGDEEWLKPCAYVRAALERSNKEGDIRGAPSLAQIMPEPIVRRAADWLGVDWANTTASPGYPGRFFTGERLRALRTRPERSSPFPGVFDPDPHLHVLIGKPMVGKTTLGLVIAKAWCAGRAPWPGAPPLPGTRALVVSREQPMKRIDHLLQRVDNDQTTVDEWTDRICLVARDPELSTEAQKLLTLDATGLEALRATLTEAREEGDPIRLVVLDSLSRLKPTSIEENDNDAMNDWLDSLEAIALEFDVYVILVHHKGHSSEGDRSDPRSAGRGASAIGAVASVILLLERCKKNRQHRSLKVEGNYIPGSEITFEVAGKEAHPGSIHYFRPLNPFAVYDPAALIGSEEISTSDLAWRLSHKPLEAGKNAPGAAGRLAADLRDHWKSEGVVEVFDGPRGARMMRLAPHLASSPRPRPDKGAKSGNLTSPTAPIEARGGGEVEEGSRGGGGVDTEGEVSEGDAPKSTPMAGPSKEGGQHNASGAVAGASGIRGSREGNSRNPADEEPSESAA